LATSWLALGADVVSDVMEKTSTRRRSRIACVVVEKKLRRVDVQA